MIILFLFLLIFYIIGYVLKYKFYKFYKPLYDWKSINLYLNLGLILVTFIYTNFTIINVSKLYCGNNNIYPFSVYVTLLLPFIVIMLTYFLFITTNNGVLIKPFSNTFGYLFSFIINLSDKFKTLLKYEDDDNKLSGKLKKLFKIVFNKPSICINEFTPYNITNKFEDFEEIIDGKIMENINNIKKGYPMENENLINFINGVRKKFLFSELIFLLLLQLISNLWTKNEVLNTKCTSSASASASANTSVSSLYNTTKNINTKRKTYVVQ